MSPPMSKDDEKARQWMLKNVKRKISDFIFPVASLIFLMTKGTSRNDISLIRLFNIRKLSHWRVQRVTCS